MLREELIELVKQIQSQHCEGQKIELKAANKGKKNWKKYPKGWTRKIETGKSRVGVTVYGKKGTYQLAHLLEFGHQLRKGGRKVGEAGAFPHIQEINDWAMDEVTGRIIEKME